MATRSGGADSGADSSAHDGDDDDQQQQHHVADPWSAAGPLIDWLAHKDPWRPTVKRRSRSPLMAFVAFVLVASASAAYAAQLLLVPAHGVTEYTVNLNGCGGKGNNVWADALGCGARLLAYPDVAASQFATPYPPNSTATAADRTVPEVVWGDAWRLLGSRRNAYSSNAALAAAEMTQLLARRAPAKDDVNFMPPALYVGPNSLASLFDVSVKLKNATTGDDVPYGECTMLPVNKYAICLTPAGAAEATVCPPNDGGAAAGGSDTATGGAASAARKPWADSCGASSRGKVVSYAEVSLGSLLSQRHQKRFELQHDRCQASTSASASEPSGSSAARGGVEYEVAVMDGTSSVGVSLLGPLTLRPGYSLTVDASLTVYVTTDHRAASQTIDSGALAQQLDHAVRLLARDPTGCVDADWVARTQAILQGAPDGEAPNLSGSLTEPGELWPTARLVWELRAAWPAEPVDNPDGKSALLAVRMNPTVTLSFEAPVKVGLYVFVAIGAGVLSLFSATGKVLGLLQTLHVATRRLAQRWWRRSTKASRHAAAAVAGALPTALQRIDITEFVPGDREARRRARARLRNFTLAHATAVCYLIVLMLLAIDALLLVAGAYLTDVWAFLATIVAIVSQTLFCVFALPGACDCTPRWLSVCITSPLAVTTMFGYTFALLVEVAGIRALGAAHVCVCLAIIGLQTDRAVFQLGPELLRRVTVIKDPLPRAVLAVALPTSMIAGPVAVLQKLLRSITEQLTGGVGMPVDAYKESAADALHRVTESVILVGFVLMVPALVVTWRAGGPTRHRLSRSSTKWAVRGALISSVFSGVGTSLMFFNGFLNPNASGFGGDLLALPRASVGVPGLAQTLVASAMVPWLDTVDGIAQRAARARRQELRESGQRTSLPEASGASAGVGAQGAAGAAGAGGEALSAPLLS